MIQSEKEAKRRLASKSAKALAPEKTASHKSPLKITIDGPAGAGKSTVAKLIANQLGYLYIDTGAMYRAVTWLMLQSGLNINDEQAVVELVRTAQILLKPGDKSSNQLARVFINGKEITKQIRTQEITKSVSQLSTIPAVRAYLVEQQRNMARAGGVVLDGRDTGTVVLPDADVKIFLTASPEVRGPKALEGVTLLWRRGKIRRPLARNYRAR